MGRVGFNEFDNYKSDGNATFFKLQDDKDTAEVRFMYNGIEDIEGVAVHTVDVEGAKYGKDVNCLRAYNEPLDECPLCKAGMKPKIKIFIPLYNITEDEVQIWTRSRSYGSTLSGLCARYTKGCNFVNNVFEIERNGAKGDKQTTYNIYPVDKDDTEISDLPQAPDPIGTAVLDKSYEDLEYYVKHGHFPNGGGSSEDSEPIRRRSSRRAEEELEEDEAPRRRERRRPSAHNDEDDF